MSVSLVAHKHGISASQLFNWRKLEREGALVAVQSGESVVPASKLAAARPDRTTAAHAQQENNGSGNSARSSRGGPRKKVDCALTLIGQGRPVKPVCAVRGVARSNVIDRLARPADWDEGRALARLDPVADALIADVVRAEITALPTYGYRRAAPW